MKKRITVEIICFLFIVLFIYAALNKLWDIQLFRVQIGQSPLLTKYANIFAILIPAIEIIISFSLAINRIRLIGLYASFIIMIMFTTYIVAILNFAEHVPCSCGGVLEKLGWTEHLIFNLVFALLGLVAILMQSNISNSSNDVTQLNAEMLHSARNPK